MANVTIPASASNVLVNPWISRAVNVIGMVGVFLSSQGINVGSIIGTLTAGNFWAGLAVAAGSQIIDHYMTMGSNTATKAAIGLPAAT